MRLAVFTSKYPARVATFFERDVRGLIEAGIDVDVFPIYPLDSSMWKYSLDALNEEVLPREKIHHLNLAQVLKSSRPYPVRSVGTYLRDAAAFNRAAMRYGAGPLAKTNYVLSKAWAWAQKHGNDYDHVLAYWGNYAGTCAYAFHRLINRPIPFSIWLHAGADLYETPIYLKQKLLYADRIFTCCAFNQKYLAEHYADIFPSISQKLSVCYHGLNFADFAYQPHGRQPNKVIAVGRLSKEKGFSYLLQAMHRLVTSGMDLELELVGDGEKAAALKTLTAQLEMMDRVRFRGWLKFNEVRTAISQATVLVHPSDGLGDGLPNVIREAMALGTPVVASDIAGIHEALDDGRCGLLVPSRDVQALANAIQTILSDAEKRQLFADRARKRAEEKFDMWRNGTRLANLLRETRPAMSPELGVATKVQPTSATLMTAEDSLL
ncbi:MAG: glycosyltransferase family 4 protein [Acidobacteriota bacterium]